MSARKPTDSSGTEKEALVQIRFPKPVKDRFKNETRQRGTSMQAVVEKHVYNYLEADNATATKVRIEEIEQEIQQVEHEIQTKKVEKKQLEAELDTLYDNLNLLVQIEHSYEDDLSTAAQAVINHGMEIGVDNPRIEEIAAEHDRSINVVVDDLQEYVEKHGDELLTDTSDDYEWGRF